MLLVTYLEDGAIWCASLIIKQQSYRASKRAPLHSAPSTRDRAPPPPRLVKKSRLASKVSLAPSISSKPHQLNDAHHSQLYKDTKANMPGEPFQPCHMFFCGSLMNPEVV
jgi:hypothetical protein